MALKVCHQLLVLTGLLNQPRKCKWLNQLQNLTKQPTFTDSKTSHLYPYWTTHEGLEIPFCSLVWQYIFKDVKKAT